jgi:hypothetical protein
MHTAERSSAASAMAFRGPGASRQRAKPCEYLLVNDETFSDARVIGDGNVG